MDPSDFSERTKASASYERQRRRITGDNDDDNDSDEETAWYNDATTDTRVYATGITAKRSGAVGTLFIIPTISEAPISCPVRARNVFPHPFPPCPASVRRTRSFPSLLRFSFSLPFIFFKDDRRKLTSPLSESKYILVVEYF